MSKTHKLKTLPIHFDAIERGDMTFGVRKNEQGFQAGDTLVLEEWNPSMRSEQSIVPMWDGDEKDMPRGYRLYDPLRHYTGRTLERLVTYVLHGGQWGLQEGYVVLALKAPTDPLIGLADLVPPQYVSKYPNIVLTGGSASVMPPIPSDVEWWENGMTFVSRGQRVPLAFRDQWFDRRHEFPKYEPAAPVSEGPVWLEKGRFADLEVPPIPECIYWDASHHAFRDSTGNPQDALFAHTWWTRRHEFPKYEPEAS